MKNYYCFIFVSLVIVGGCKKFTEVDFPVNQVGSESVFATDANARAAVAGIYTDMMSVPNQFANCSVTFYAGLSADELLYYSPDIKEEFARNEITQQNHPYLAVELWGRAYQYIYTTNLCIQKLQASNTLSPEVKDRLLGECFYLRAYSYFFLVNLFGEVPLTTETDYKSNMRLPRAEVGAVYRQLTDDFVKAAAMLPATYAMPEKSVPNKWAARAMLAKAYLYRQEWDSAALHSDAIIQSGLYQLQSNLNDVFLKGSSETLWQLAPVLSLRNSWEGYYINPSSANALPTYI
ncbi:MAG: hypothetical protein EOP51_32175, partial [Sphingobacteriales bacterium]